MLWITLDQSKDETQNFYRIVFLWLCWITVICPAPAFCQLIWNLTKMYKVLQLKGKAEF